MRPWILVLLTFPAILAGEEPAEPLREAQTHFKKGRLEEAREAFAALTAKQPVDAAIGISRTHRAEGAMQAAADVLQKGLKETPKEARLWAELARIQFERGQFSEAETSVAKALEQDAESPLARLVQADLQAETGKLKEADDGYRWFVRYYNRVQPKDAETLLVVARGSAQYARWHSVPQIFDFVVNTLSPDALAADPEAWESYFLSGSLLLEKYNREQAIPELRQALAINPRAAEVHVALGEAALQQVDLTAAGQSADRALEVNPRLVPALRLKANLALNDGGTAKARPFLERARAENPHDQETLALIATCDLLEDGPPAAEELDELLAHLDAVQELGDKNRGRFATLVIELAGRNPRPGRFFGLLGKMLEARRKFELAERFYKQAIVSMPQLSEPKTDLGLLYMRVGKGDEARKLLDSAFEADPYHVRVSNMRKVLKLLDGYEVITTDHFVIRIDSQADKLLGKYMAEYLEQEYPALVAQFGFEPATRTQFEVFNKSKGLSAHEWFSARMVGLPWIQTIGASTGMIVALASPNAQEKPFNWARVVKHEFIHILTLQQTDFNIPHWFTEALATHNEGYPRPASWDALLVERVAQGKLMNLDNLNLGFIRPKTPLDWQLAYCQSELYAQYMLEKYGPESLPKLLAAYRENLATDAALKRAFDVEKAEFEAGYLAYVKKIAEGIRAQATEPARPLAELEKAHEARPDDPQAGAAYAYELLKLKRLKQARELAENALVQNDREPLAAVVLAQLELRSQDTDAAIKYLDRALDRESPHPLVLELLAKIRLEQQEYAQAAELYKLGRKQSPGNVEWLQGLAAAYIKLEDEAQLKPILEALAELEADDVLIRVKRAQLALAEQDFAAAIKYGTLALHIDVLDPHVHRILGDAYLGQKDLERSAAEYAVAVEINPDDAASELGWAKALLASGDKTAAKEHVQKVLERDPESDEARELLKTLK